MQPPRLTCPCCGESFDLTPAMLASITAAPERPSRSSVKPEQRPATTTSTMEVVFDGGSKGNPGQGYGSYRLTVDGQALRPVRLEFSAQHTNNEAEYDTLITALDAIVSSAKHPATIALTIRGDSQLVINQLTGRWKARDARMQERLKQANLLLKQFGNWQAVWHDRSHSVDALGH